MKKRDMHLRIDKTGDAMGRPSWRSSFLDEPSAKFLCEKLRNGKKKEKLTPAYAAS